MASKNYKQVAIDHGWYEEGTGKPFIWQEAYSPCLREWASGRFWLFYSQFAPNLKEWPNRKLKNVYPIMSACSDKVCTLTISKSRENHLGNNIFTDNPSNDFDEVQGMPIDLIIEKEKIKKVNFLKMNIEGAELIALKGATKLMSSGASFVVSCHDFKYHEGQGDFFKTFDDVKKLVSTNNLSTYSRDHDQRRDVPYYLYAK